MTSQIVTANNLILGVTFDREDAVETWLKVVSEFGAWYQRGADARQTAAALRHRRAG